MPISPTQPQVDVRQQRGQALKNARKAAALTAQDLAQRVNDLTAGSDLTHHAIYSYERGKVLLSREAGHRIAEALSIHPGELLLGDPDYRPVGSADRGGVDADMVLDVPLGPTFRLAEPIESIDTSAYPGIDLRQRVAFINAAAKLPAVGYVLTRLLDTAKLGRVEIAGYLDVFYVLLADLNATLDSDAHQAIQNFGPDEGNEALWKLSQRLTGLKTQTDASFAKLVDPAGQTASSVFETCETYRESLRKAVLQIRADIRHANRGLPIVGVDAE